MRAFLAALFICAASPAFAQMDALLQGPWNVHAQHRAIKAPASYGLPPRNKRCGWYMGRLTGHHDRDLWLARNWAFKFPRVHARAGAVVVWPHHVARIVSMQGNCRAVVHDNAGTYSRNICNAMAYVQP